MDSTPPAAPGPDVDHPDVTPAPDPDNPHLSWLSSAALVGAVVGTGVLVGGVLWGADGSSDLGWGPVLAVLVGLGLLAWGGAAALLLAACRALRWRDRR